MIRRFFSDGRLSLKLAALLLAYLGLLACYSLHQPEKGRSWREIADWHASPNGRLGRRAELSVVKVLGRLPGNAGLKIGLGPKRIEVDLFGPVQARAGDYIDFAAVFEPPGRLRLIEAHVYTTPRWLKLGVSLLAAVLAVGLFAWCFRFSPGRGRLFFPRGE